MPLADGHQFANTKGNHTFAIALKKLLSIFLAFVILLQVFVNVGIGVYYHFNKAYITQKLCENRSNPKLHCNGHCYLSKQLKKAEEGEKNHASNVLKEKEEIISDQYDNGLPNYFPAITVTQFKITNSVLYLLDSEHDLLKPPVV